MLYPVGLGKQSHRCEFLLFGETVSPLDLSCSAECWKSETIELNPRESFQPQDPLAEKVVL